MSERKNERIWPVSVAPMMDWTDRHFRYFMRQITKKTLLYTEMITAEAILRGDRSFLLDYSPEEHPIVFQIGGNCPDKLFEAAKIVEDWGYDEINLNVGCPSGKVSQANFGACLMAEPDTVARAIESMQKAVEIPVTVKHRIGIDGLERYEDLHRFVSIVKESGCRRFIVHARIAILGGLSPKENRTIPPIRYNDVYQLKEDFPELIIEINGQVKTISQIQEHLEKVDSVMIGRAAYEDPFLFSTVDHQFFGEPSSQITREEVIEKMIPYINDWFERGKSCHYIVRHMLGLWKGQPGARKWRRLLSEHSKQKLSPKHLENALSEMRDIRAQLLATQQQSQSSSVSI